MIYQISCAHVRLITHGTLHWIPTFNTATCEYASNFVWDTAVLPTSVHLAAVILPLTTLPLWSVSSSGVLLPSFRTRGATG